MKENSQKVAFCGKETRGSYYGINMILLTTEHTFLTFQLQSNNCQTLNRLQLCGGSSQSGEKSGDSVALGLRTSGMLFSHFYLLLNLLADLVAA